MTKSEREWGMGLARQLLAGQMSLRQAVGEIRGFNLARTDIVRMTLDEGQFAIGIPLDGKRDLYSAQAVKTAGVLEKMILDKDFGLSTTNYLWDQVGHGLHQEWKVALCEHFSCKGLYAVLMTEPSDAFKPENTGMLALPGKVAPYIPVDKQDEITEMARRSRKLAALYALTGWEACRQKAVGADRDAILGSDLGL